MAGWAWMLIGVYSTVAVLGGYLSVLIEQQDRYDPEPMYRRILRDIGYCIVWPITMVRIFYESRGPK